MKILYIIPSLAKGGAERLVLTICNALQKQTDCEVRLVTFSDFNEYGELTTNIQWDIIPAIYIPSLTKKPTKNVTELQSYIELYSPDVIHTHLWQTEMVCSQISYTKAVWVTHFHDNMIQLHKQFVPTSKTAITNAYERSIVLGAYKKRNTKFICISNDTLKFAKQNLPKQKQKDIHLLYNAIDIANFAYTEREYTTDCLTLVCVGSLVDKKNQIFLIPVISHILSKNIYCHLHMLGNGYNKEKIQNKIQELGVEKHITLHGNIAVEPFYKQANIYVHAATYEPFGLVLLEAMAAGLPVICLDGKGNRDIIEEGKNGYMIFDSNPIVFAEKIISLWNNQSLLQEISLYARSYVTAYDISSYLNNLLTLYKK